MSQSTIEFPAPRKLNGRLFWDRLDIENYKRALLGLPPLDRNPSTPIELVPASQVTREVGFGRRTLGRRIAASTTNSDQAA